MKKTTEALARTAMNLSI